MLLVVRSGHGIVHRVGLVCSSKNRSWVVYTATHMRSSSNKTEHRYCRTCLRSKISAPKPPSVRNSFAIKCHWDHYCFTMRRRSLTWWRGARLSVNRLIKSDPPPYLNAQILPRVDFSPTSRHSYRLLLCRFRFAVQGRSLFPFVPVTLNIDSRMGVNMHGLAVVLPQKGWAASTASPVPRSATRLGWIQLI